MSTFCQEPKRGCGRVSQQSLADRLSAECARHLFLGGRRWLSPSKICHRHLFSGATLPHSRSFLHEQFLCGTRTRCQSHQVNLSHYLVSICPQSLVRLWIYAPVALIPNVRYRLHRLRLGASLHCFISYHVEIALVKRPAKRITGISVDDALYPPGASPLLRATCDLYGVAITWECNPRVQAACRGDLEPVSSAGPGDPQLPRGFFSDVLPSAERPAREIHARKSLNFKINQLRFTGHEFSRTHWHVRSAHLNHSIPGRVLCEVRPGTQSGVIDSAANFITQSSTTLGDGVRSFFLWGQVFGYPVVFLVMTAHQG